MKWKNTFLVGIYKCELTYSHGKNLQAKLVATPCLVANCPIKRSLNTDPAATT
jgi:hypothetical protein